MAYTNLTTANPTTYPLAANTPSATKTSAVAWTPSPYVRIFSAYHKAIRINSLSIFVALANGFEYELDLAYGPAGNESVFCTIPAASGSGGSIRDVVALPVPIDVDAMKDIFFRFRTASLTTGLIMQAYLNFEDVGAAVYALGRQRGRRRPAG